MSRATLNGTLERDSGIPADCYFEWGIDTTYGNDTYADATLCNEGDSFSIELEEFVRGHTYHFRAVAESVLGTVYGNDRTFKIPTAYPEVEALSAAAYGSRARLTGLLKEDGCVPCICGFNWGETTAYGRTTLTESLHAGAGFTFNTDYLDRDIVYHYRAFAHNYTGTYYSPDKTFKLSALPDMLTSVVTLEAVDVLRHCATIKGILLNDGGRARTIGFQWGISPTNLDNLWIVETDVRSIKEFSGILQGLTPETQYHYRALAGNDYDYGDILSFTTQTKEEEIIIPPKPPKPWVPFPPKTEKIAFDFMNLGIVTTGAAGIALPFIAVAGGMLPAATAISAIPGRTDAQLTGIISSDTGQYCEARFRWRRIDSKVWTETAWWGRLRLKQQFRTNISGLLPGTKHEFQVQARTVSHEGQWSRSLVFTTIK